MTRSHCRWLDSMLPNGILERPPRYPDSDEWFRTMRANSKWLYPAEHSSIVAAFASFFFLGKQIRFALDCAQKLAGQRQLTPRVLSALHRVISLQAAIAGFVTSEILIAIREVEVRSNTTFCVGANHEGSAEALLNFLRPETEALWREYTSLLASIDSLRKYPDEMSDEETVALLVKEFRGCQKLAVEVAKASCVDYLFHLRKNTSKKEFVTIIKKRVSLGKYTDYPTYQGKRLRVISTLICTGPKYGYKNLDPVPVPFRWLFFKTVCPAVHWIGFVRHMNLIKRQAEKSDGCGHRASDRATRPAKLLWQRRRLAPSK